MGSFQRDWFVLGQLHSSLELRDAVLEFLQGVTNEETNFPAERQLLNEFLEDFDEDERIEVVNLLTKSGILSKSRMKVLLELSLYSLLLVLGAFTGGILWPRRIRRVLLNYLSSMSNDHNQRDKKEKPLEMLGKLEERVQTFDVEMKALKSEMEQVKQETKNMNDKLDLILEHFKKKKFFL
eukprot:CAMPEP_0118681228 /NCGR_PEP_ID=MMETSP0800-20121206/4819_1 /TAXON_ID=210618 ORGANISM="Striatella unipunctata, Strain CCMP2910" /NCGR_SAMPLE_ID=MMETSP0800 /ASSEMBLY_ACC=CAM_ASM_000638 /LENGTH=180 /DNA_ID=CAMNT_0006577495 /DNA_START=459 /DNA_END=1001 /DNA_ORIENTATION=+